MVNRKSRSSAERNRRHTSFSLSTAVAEATISMPLRLQTVSRQNTRGNSDLSFVLTLARPAAAKLPFSLIRRDLLRPEASLCIPRPMDKESPQEDGRNSTRDLMRLSQRSEVKFFKKSSKMTEKQISDLNIH